MTKRNGLPCKKCGTSAWYENSYCKQCARATRRKWDAANRERVRLRSRVWDTDNRAKVRASNNAWRAANLDKINAKANRYRTRKTAAGGSYTSVEWLMLCDRYNMRCLACGGLKPLTADHVIPVSKGGASNIDNIQPLCQSCNSKKGTKSTDYR